MIARLRDRVEELYFRLAASGLAPRRPFAPPMPKRSNGPPSGGEHRLEIVSHCWRYEHLLNYQLSSLVLYPPRDTPIRMTVFFSEEDENTREVLDFFGAQQVRNVAWNWQSLSTPRLFRRSIGRNLAARSTKADWVWFADCDITCRAGALDELSEELSGCSAILAFPREHQVTELLEPDDPLLAISDQAPKILDVDRNRFRPEIRDRAVGGLQIVPGDVARTAGYCAGIGVYQRPAPKFGNTWEDRTYRWLLGTQGVGLESSGFYRIRHKVKGRYRSGPLRRQLSSGG